MRSLPLNKSVMSKLKVWLGVETQDPRSVAPQDDPLPSWWHMFGGTGRSLCVKVLLCGCAGNARNMDLEV